MADCSPADRRNENGGIPLTRCQRRGGPDAALSVWVTQEQEALARRTHQSTHWIGIPTFRASIYHLADPHRHPAGLTVTANLADLSLLQFTVAIFSIRNSPITLVDFQDTIPVLHLARHLAIQIVA